MIQAAIRLVVRDGLKSLTYRSLAAEAYVSMGALQHHFSSLDEVVQAAYKQSVDRGLRRVETSETAATFFEGLLESLDVDFEIQAFQVAVMLEARHSPELRRFVRRQQDKYRRAMVRALQAMEAPADSEAVEALMALADGMIYQRVVLGSSHRRITRMQAKWVQQTVTDLIAKPTDV